MSFSLFPKKIYETTSKFNKEIKVLEQFGRVSLSVDNLTQSGGIVNSIWKKPISILKLKKIKKTIILGFGGGTLVNILLRKNSELEITGVEIDKKAIFVAKKFFKIKESKNLKIVNKDALLFLKETKEKYDLVLVDLYNGSKRPDFVEGKEFLELIKERMNKNAKVIFNWLKVDSYFDFERILRRNFKDFKTVKGRTNMFFIASD